MQFDTKDYQRPQFTSRALCAAASIDSSTLKNWLSRSPAVVVLTDQEKQKYSTRREAFSLARTLHIAAIAELVFTGYELKQAVNKLAHFWYSAGSSYLPNEGDRAPGELYQRGLSILVCSVPHEPGRLLNFESKSDPILSYMTGLSSTIIDMSALDERVRASLTAFDPHRLGEAD